MKIPLFRKMTPPLLTAALAALFTPSLFAEGPPSNWPKSGWASDDFSWFNNNKWQKSNYTNSNNSDDFRAANVKIITLGGGNKGAEVVMKSENNNHNDYTGGWFDSKTSYWRVGWWEARLKLDWTRDNVWPTWWMWSKWNTGIVGEELDIMEFQTESLDHAHWKHQFSNGGKWLVGTQHAGYNKKTRMWNAWHHGVNSTPEWEHNWAMARCRSWTNWAVKVGNGQNARFFINGKQEHTGDKVWQGMRFIFSGSPQNNRLPARGTNLPNMKIDWINGFHP